MLLFPPPLHLVLNLEEGASIFNGKLNDDHNCLEEFAMIHAPGLEVTFCCLVTRTDMGLLPLASDWVAWIILELDLVGHTDIAIVTLDMLAWLEEVLQNLVKDLDIIE